MAYIRLSRILPVNLPVCFTIETSPNSVNAAFRRAFIRHNGKPTRQPEAPYGLSPEDKKVYEELEQPVDLPNLTPTTSVSEVINELRNSVDPPLQIQPNWRDLLETADIEPTAPANMEPLTGVKLRKALEVLLTGLSTDLVKIGYVVDEGVILIGTEDNLPKKLVTRVYDITDLVGEPAQYGGIQGISLGSVIGQLSSGTGYGGGGYGGGGGLGGYGGGGLGGGLGGYGGGGLGGIGGGLHFSKIVIQDIDIDGEAGGIQFVFVFHIGAF